MMSFEAPEVMIGRDKVVDEEKVKLKHISEQIAKEYKMDYSNPFRQLKDGSSKDIDYSYLYEDIEEEKKSGD
jgi:hypothetical protein